MSAFRHADHIDLALQYLRAAPTVDAATDRMAATLRAKAAEAGAPEKYHHTVTVFWMRMVARLLDKNLPLAYYSRGRLESAEARTGWVAPDRRPLPDDAPTIDPGDSPGDAPHRPVHR